MVRRGYTKSTGICEIDQSRVAVHVGRGINIFVIRADELSEVAELDVADG